VPPVDPVPVAPPEPESPVGVVDPFGLAPACLRLSPGAFRTGRVALAVLSALLDEGERVDLVVQGRYQHYAGVAALTDRRLVLVNDHEWVPDVRSITVTPDLAVQGWEDDRSASLVFEADGRSITIDLIDDRPLAHELAQAVRQRAAAAG
jgi:hypothetical protein